MKAQNAIDIIILGFGKIGRELARQILSVSSQETIRHLMLRIIGLADSQALYSRVDGLSPAEIMAASHQKQTGNSLKEMDMALPLDRISTLLQPNTILVDTSASQDTLPYLKWAVDANAGIVLANKIPLCQPWAKTEALFLYPNIRYEATVGAGLPIISTLKYLLETGDKPDSIVGCLSGTLGYLCSQLEKGIPYSQAVLDAYSLGYTEPDPRQDLSGLDVARKAIILSRTAGIMSELPELAVDPLFPTELSGLSVEDFLQEIQYENDRYTKLVKKAAANQQVPRYSAQISSDEIKVGLVFADKFGSLGSLSGPDNFIALKTQRYSASPLVISGPGAGIEVTAAGVLGDIIQLGKEMAKGGNR